METDFHFQETVKSAERERSLKYFHFIKNSWNNKEFLYKDFHLDIIYE